MNGRKRIRIFATAGLIFVAVIWVGVAPAVQEKELLPVKVHQLLMDPSSMQPIVLLADSAGERALPIWIGPCEADAINLELQGIKPPRPLTHDLLKSVIQKMNGRIQRVVVTERRENTYYAVLSIERGGSVIEIDARPSDSIVLSLKHKAPLFVSRALFNELAVPLGEKKGIEDPYGLTLQDLTPLLAQSFAFWSTNGLLVADVRQGSPAEEDGLKRGDILAELAGQTVRGLGSFRESMAKSKAPVSARIFRKGSYISLTLHPK